MLKRRLVVLAASVVTALFMFAASAGAATTTATTAPAPAPPPTDWQGLDTVVSNLQSWMMGLLGAVATLFVVIGGVRYVLSGGDPSQVEKAKLALRGALVGYALALLAPIVLAVLKHIVGK